MYYGLTRNEMRELLGSGKIESLAFSLTPGVADLVYTDADDLPDADTMGSTRYRTLIQPISAGSITLGAVVVTDPTVPEQQQAVFVCGEAATHDADLLAAVTPLATEATVGQVADDLATLSAYVQGKLATEDALQDIYTNIYDLVGFVGGLSGPL